MANSNDDILQTWRELGVRIESLRSQMDEFKKERRTALITLIERKKNVLTMEKSTFEERPESPKALEVYQMPDPWDNYYYGEGLFYTRAITGNHESRGRMPLRQIGESETDVLVGGSNLIEVLLALPDSR